MKIFLFVFTLIFVSGCSVFGDNGVENAPYKVLEVKTDEPKIEVRLYEPMVLVSTNMVGDSANSAFRKLFKYISGENQSSTQIAMTAPVMMDNTKDTNYKNESSQNSGEKIAMTAPVFMDKNANVPTMSFVMPKDFTLATTPTPNDPEVRLSQLSSYKVAAIVFNWTLSESNVQKHTKLLEQWIIENGYVATGKAITAGYNSPFTLPMFRRNEVMIPIQ